MIEKHARALAYPYQRPQDVREELEMHIRIVTDPHVCRVVEAGALDDEWDTTVRPFRRWHACTYLADE